MRLRVLQKNGRTTTMGTNVTSFEISPLSTPTGGIIALVITCIDYRLVEDAVTYLNSEGYQDQYDEFILAGASLGYNTSLNVVNSQFSGWDKVLENHIDISYSLHKIKDIIVIDHMDCGAYKAQLNGGASFTKYEEVKKHIENLNTFRNTINAKYIDDGKPKYTVKLWLMRLNGTVDIYPTYWQFTTKKIKVPKTNVVVIGNATLPNLTSVGTIDQPSSTLSKLSYKLLDKDGKDTSPSAFITLSNDGDIWYIQSKSTPSEFGSLNTEEYRLQLDDSLAYITVKLSIDTAGDSGITFTFEQSDYF